LAKAPLVALLVICFVGYGLLCSKHRLFLQQPNAQTPDVDGTAVRVRVFRIRFTFCCVPTAPAATLFS
jgi:hypothetical protein